MSKRLSVSFIIPVGESSDQLQELLCALASGQAWPQEILIVYASSESKAFVDDLQILISELPPLFALGIRVLTPGRPLFPGAARNVGISQSNFDWLAFLDVNTIPSESWLASAYESVDLQLKPIVCGTTKYMYSSWKQLLFIKATYGQKPLRTLPGTIIHRSILNQVGCFLPGVRAGEDTDWLVRAHQLGFKLSQVQGSFLAYRAVPNTLRALTAKWFRNYRSCAPVVFHLETQKTIYVVIANCFALYIAFRWNELAAGWQESNYLYVDNVTKITIFLIILMYFLLRGLVLPIRRGSSLVGLLPFQWLIIGVICFVLDVTKLVAFALPPWRNRNIL